MVLLNPGVGDASANCRAAEAEDAVLHRFVGRFQRLPGTRIARTSAPAAMAARPHSGLVPVDRSTPFHYWWQAHLLDAIVDAGHRKLRESSEGAARRTAQLGRQLLRTIVLRNGLAVRNHYYDDMAWLALSTHRLEHLHRQLGETMGEGLRRWALGSLTRQLESGQQDSGGLFWNKDRDFLNAAATGPAALHLLRSGRVAEGRRGVEWILDRLTDGRGLIMDGIRVSGGVETRVYTYNQGPIIAALLELGEEEDLELASVLIQAVGAHLRTAQRDSLITHRGGDGGLFTGILVRYLALACMHERLATESRVTAETLVRGTATALWEARDESGIFSATLSPRKAASPQCPSWVELSTQLQGWMVMEAVAAIDARRGAET